MRSDRGAARQVCRRNPWTIGRSSHSSLKHFRRKPLIAYHLIRHCLALAQSHKSLFPTKKYFSSRARTTNRVRAHTRTTPMSVPEPELHRRSALGTLKER
eukprot:1421607-Pleurochrysis_carterae.AAC.1